MSDYKNNLYVEASVIPPPTKIYRLEPTKDAYITQEYPYDEFGDYSLLQLKSSTIENQSTSKIIMVFQVPTIKDDILKNLIDVNLVLKSPSKFNREAKIQIKNHTDIDWIEDGTTWLGQPRDLDPILYETTFQPNSREIRWNIKDMFLSHNNEPFLLPITILENPDDGDQKELLFFSKESGKVNCPAIEFSYKYFPDNLDIQDFKGTFKVRRTIPNDDEKAPDLKGKLIIDKGLSSSWIPGIVDIKGYPGEDDLTGSIIIKQDGKAFGPPSVVTIKQYVDPDHPYNTIPDLTGVLYTKLYKADSGDKTPADPDWLERIPAADLEGKITPTTYDNQNEINGTLNVNGREDLEGTLVINNYIAKPLPDSGEDIPPGTNYINPSDLNGTLTVKINMDPELKPGDPGYIEIPYLDGTLIINKYIAKPSPDGEDIPPGTNYIAPADLNSTLKVLIKVPNDNQEAPELKGTLYVRSYVADDDIDSTTDREIHKVSPGLDGTINISSREDLNGTVGIKFYDDQLDTLGKLIVKCNEHEDLNGYLNLKVHSNSDLRGTLNVSPRRTSDLVGTLEIETEESSVSKNSYAFIM